MKDAVIVSAARTAVGKAPNGTLRGARPDELGAVATFEKPVAPSSVVNALRELLPDHL